MCREYVVYQNSFRGHMSKMSWLPLLYSLSFYLPGFVEWFSVSLTLPLDCGDHVYLSYCIPDAYHNAPHFVHIHWTCNREEPNLTTCWICFFYFNLCFRLLLFTQRILSIHNGLPRGTLPLCLNVKPKCLCSGKHPDPVHLQMAARKEKLTQPLPEAGHSRGYLQNLWPFYFTSSSPPRLCAMKETGIQTSIRWLFWDFSLLPSQSASFPNKVIFLASTPHLRFIDLLCGEQSRLGLGNKCVKCTYEIMAKWAKGQVYMMRWSFPYLIFIFVWATHSRNFWNLISLWWCYYPFSKLLDVIAELCICYTLFDLPCDFFNNSFIEM